MELNKEVFRYHFARGTWISIAWNWLLINVGRAAEGYLTLSVLYQGASLLPGVHTPASLDNTVFIGQQLALDVGGISLAKQSQQTRQTNVAQANLERKVGFLLIGLMIANVLLSQLKRLQVISPDVLIVIEATLLILRSIMAVIYGYIVYSPTMSEDTSVVRTSDIRERLDEYSKKVEQIETSTSQQIQKVVDAFQQTQAFQYGQILQLTESIRTLENTFQYTITETLHGMENTFQLRLTERLSTITESLSVLPELTEQISQIEASTQFQLRTVTEEFAQARETIGESLDALPRLIERTVVQRVSTVAPVSVQPRTLKPAKAPLQLPPRSSESVDFNKRQFVYECLTEDPEMPISEIRRRATERGQNLSVGSASTYRTDFQNSLSVQPTERDESGPITGEFEKIVVNE